MLKESHSRADTANRFTNSGLTRSQGVHIVTTTASLRTVDPEESAEPISGNIIIIAVSVVMVGLIILVAIIAILICYLKRRKKSNPTPGAAAVASRHAPVLATIIPHPNPTYQNELQPPYMASPGEYPYDNIAFDIDDEKKEKI